MKRAKLIVLIGTMFFGLTAMGANAAELVYKTEIVEVLGIKIELVKRPITSLFFMTPRDL